MIKGLSTPELHIITGDLHSGKTTALIEMADTWASIGIPVAVLKPEKAVGHGEQFGAFLESYGLLRVKALPIPDNSILLYPRELTTALQSDVICIDEAHLLEQSLLDTVGILLTHGKTVYVSGLWRYEGLVSNIQGLVPVATTIRMKKGRALV